MQTGQLVCIDEWGAPGPMFLPVYRQSPTICGRLLRGRCHVPERAMSPMVPVPIVAAWTGYGPMQISCLVVRISNRSPTIAGVAITISCILFSASNLNSGPVWTTYTQPASSTK